MLSIGRVIFKQYIKCFGVRIYRLYNMTGYIYMRIRKGQARCNICNSQNSE